MCLSEKMEKPEAIFRSLQSPSVLETLGSMRPSALSRGTPSKRWVHVSRPVRLKPEVTSTWTEEVKAGAKSNLISLKTHLSADPYTH